MLRKLYRIIIPAFLMTLPAQPASAAAFSLPSDAVIHVEAFTFPEALANAAEQNFPDLLQTRLTEALQKAGFTMDHASSAPSVSSSKELAATPITENGEAKKEQKEESAETANSSTEQVVDGRAAEQAPEENDRPNAIQSVFASRVSSGPAGYTLEGRVTLLRENLSAPLRIGGGVRIRAESVIHCAYRVKDSSGKTLISSTASGSSAKLTTAPNVDTALADLTEKVMTNMAEQIASRLGGVEMGSSSFPESGKEYYQDSPGKRLKKE